MQNSLYWLELHAYYWQWPRWCVAWQNQLFSLQQSLVLMVGVHRNGWKNHDKPMWLFWGGGALPSFTNHFILGYFTVITVWIQCRICHQQIWWKALAFTGSPVHCGFTYGFHWIRSPDWKAAIVVLWNLSTCLVFLFHIYVGFCKGIFSLDDGSG